MQLSWFLRRRTLLVPTLAGWAALAALAAGLAAVTAVGLPRWLALDEPVGRGALVVEGWQPRSALQRAAEVARSGAYDAVFVTGGPVGDVEWDGGYATFAERAGAYLRGRVGAVELVVVPAPETARERTWESARALRRFLDTQGRRVETVDVLTEGPHARRSRALFQRALGREIRVGVRAVAPTDYDLARWWQRSEGARDVLGEAIGYAWATCWFLPTQGG